MIPGKRDSIPFNRPYLTGRELTYLEKVVSAGALSGGGEFTRIVEEFVATVTGAGRALLTASCSAALDMCGILLDLAPGDEVIMPSFTFVSTANAFALRGATPVFVDCRPDTLNIDERLLDAAITARTRAIVVLHYGGVGCDMDTILDVARRHGLAVVEDNAHGLGGSYRGRPLGSLGSLATQSFHATKNLQCGEGGALLVNDDSLTERAETVREKGTNRMQFDRGRVAKYTWVDLGSSFLPSELQAAFLAAQAEELDDIQRRRHRIWAQYHRRLAGWATANGVDTATVPEDRTHTAHLFYVVLPTHAAQQSLLDHLRAGGVQGTFHYQPLHLSAAGRRHGRVAAGGCPVTERVAPRLVRLPLYPTLGQADVDRVIDAVTSFEVPS